MREKLEQRRALRVIPALAWMAIIFALSAQSKIPSAPGFGANISASIGHLIAYGLLGVLLLIGLATWFPLSRRTVIVAVLLAAAYGVSDEIHQSFVPGRDPSLIDLALDAIGATIATTIFYTIRTTRRDET